MPVACNSKALLSASKGFQGIPDGRKWDVLDYVWTQIAMTTTDPNQLMSLSKAFQAVPDGRKLDVALYLMRAVVGLGSTTPTQLMALSAPFQSIPSDSRKLDVLIYLACQGQGH